MGFPRLRQAFWGTIHQGNLRQFQGVATLGSSVRRIPSVPDDYAWPHRPAYDRGNLSSRSRVACPGDSCGIVAVLALSILNKEAWGWAIGVGVANRSARGLSPACYGDLLDQVY